MKKIIIGIVLIVLVILVANSLSENKDASARVTSFEECIKAGNAVLESYPRQCKTKDGKTFVENIGNTLEKRDLIVLNDPQPNAVVTSPLTVSGKARGYWFFEASFPAAVLDSNGKELGISPIQAEGEWMTENLVPFKGTITFAKPTTATGTLILRKDNPSGDPKFDDALVIPVTFGE